MKKFIITLAVLYITLQSFATPESVLSTFKRNYPTAEKVTWSDESNLYLVYFKKGDEQFRIWYDENGVVTKSIRYYEKELLSPFIRSRVEDKYKGKNIFGITEVTTDSGVTYLLFLEDDKNWYHVSSDATGNLSLIEKFKKS